MARCMFPYTVERKLYFSQTEKYVQVPCGKCPNCLKRRLASWSFRLETEALLWQTQYFVTLTYDTEFVPISKNGFMTLDTDHPKLFFKRLRKLSGKLKYYLCGEYGTQGKRPHYHLIIFGTTNLQPEHIVSCWTHPQTKKPYGNVHFGEVTEASIRYTVQYFDKGDWYQAHKRDDRTPEFSRMSKGIGESFLTPEMVQHLLDNPDKGFLYDHQGHKIAIPTYYKRRLYDYVINSSVASNHPSILLHRDNMLVKKEIHNEEMKKLMEEIEQPEETATLLEDRRAAVQNYRQSKRKARK